MRGATHYRPGVGIVLVNGQGLVFVGHRRDHRPSPWQMPQGGLQVGERPDAAALRELAEELGTRQARIVDVVPDWLRYDYPRDLPTARAKCFRGQQHRWFLMAFQGEDRDIAIDTAHPEFDDWHWRTAEAVVEAVVPFKRPVYRQVLGYFAPVIAQLRRNHAAVPQYPLPTLPSYRLPAVLSPQLAADSRATACIKSSAATGL